MTIYLIIYFICFAFIARYRFSLALSFLIFLLPTYLLRFDIFGIPTTILEIMLLILLLAWLAKSGLKKIYNDSARLIKKYPYFFTASFLFLFAATISVSFATETRAALGQWKAFYIEPFLFFFMMLHVCKKGIKIKNMLFALMLSGLATGILVTYQHFTGWMVPWDFWENGNTFRVTGWYGFPNGVGFYLALVFPAAMYVMHMWQGKWQSYVGLLTQILIVLGIIFAKSTGALVGIIGTMLILALLNKRGRPFAIGLISIGILFLLFAPATNNIKKELLLQDRSGQIRISMWNEATDMLTDSRTNAVFGVGLASYKKRIQPYHTTVNGEGIEIFHHPHNQFLSFWSEIGLLGLISFLYMIFMLYSIFFKSQKKSLSYTAFVLLNIFIIMSLVDSPYIKNDTAILFWLIPTLLLIDRKLTTNN